jgi:hypothetical protein
MCVERNDVGRLRTIVAMETISCTLQACVTVNSIKLLTVVQKCFMANLHGRKQ